jgi:hypothetical protein
LGNLQLLVTPKYLPPDRAHPRTKEARRERPLSEEHYAVFLDGTFLLIRRGKRLRNPCTWLSGSSPMDEGKSSVLALRRGRGKRPELGRGSQGPQAARGPKCGDLHHR